MPQDDIVDQQLQALGYQPDYPPRAIRGVHLNDAQYDDYVRIAGRLSKMQLESLVSQAEWSAVPDASKLPIMRGIIRKSRDIAQTSIMLKSQGGENDIVRKATDAKLARINAAQDQAPTP